MDQDQTHISGLLESCKKGSHKAQFELYKRYYKAMYNTALRIVQDTYEAEDMMQESFLKAFDKLDSFKGEVAFGAWLKRIVINQSLTHIKKKKRLMKVSLEKVNESEINDADMDENYNSMASADLRVVEVKEAINKLNDNYRLVLNLSLIEGFDNREVADILNISHQNCRTTLSRAKKSLRKILADVRVLN